MCEMFSKTIKKGRKALTIFGVPLRPLVSELPSTWPLPKLSSLLQSYGDALVLPWSTKILRQIKQFRPSINLNNKGWETTRLSRLLSESTGYGLGLTGKLDVLQEYLFFCSTIAVWRADVWVSICFSNWLYKLSMDALSIFGSSWNQQNIYTVNSWHTAHTYIIKSAITKCIKKIFTYSKITDYTNFILTSAVQNFGLHANEKLSHGSLIL